MQVRFVVINKDSDDVCGWFETEVDAIEEAKACARDYPEDEFIVFQAIGSCQVREAHFTRF